MPNTADVAPRHGSQGLVLLARHDANASFLTNGSAAFFWKLHCHWLKSLQQHRITSVRQDLELQNKDLHINIDLTSIRLGLMWKWYWFENLCDTEHDGLPRNHMSYVCFVPYFCAFCVWHARAWIEAPQPLLLPVHYFNIKTIFPGIRIPTIKIRQSWDSLILILAFPILVIWHIYSETAPVTIDHLTLCILNFLFGKKK